MRSLYLAPVAIISLLLFSAGCFEKELDDEGHNTQIPLKTLSSYPVALEEGQTGTLSLPFIGVNLVETDVKHHWDMPENVTGVVVNVSWMESGWDVELSTGTGDCPHSGMSMAEETGSSGQISVEYSAPGNQTLETGQWFCHIAVLDLNSHRGGSLNYVFEVALLSYEEVDCEEDVCPV